MNFLSSISNEKKIAISTVAFASLTVGGFFLFRKRTGYKIVEDAKKFVGIKEIHPNQGWNNKYFETLMKKVGWQLKWDYCVLFTKLILLRTLKGKQREIVKKLFTPSSQTTWANLVKNQKLGLYKLSKKPKVGAIAFYKHMNADWRGHADIVGLNFDDKKYDVITANGTIGVEEKKRKYRYNSQTMRLLGFVIF